MVTEPIRRFPHPPLDRPALVVALEGWIDAGAAALTATQTILAAVHPEPVAEFDTDTFVDYRARRPTLHLRDGVNTGLTWPRLALDRGVDPAGTQLLVLHGPEPDSNWQRFLDTCEALVAELGVRLVCGLGAYPVAVPHTRPSRVVATSPDRALAERVAVVPAALDLPGGLAAALEARCGQRGVPALSIWAQVPHYATGMPYHAAALALIETLNRVAGLALPTEGLRAAAATQQHQIDQLVGNSAEHAAMVRRMEADYDAEAAGPAEPLVPPGAPLPSGEELAGELEQYLREHGDGER